MVPLVDKKISCPGSLLCQLRLVRLKKSTELFKTMSFTEEKTPLQASHIFAASLAIKANSSYETDLVLAP